MERQNYLYLAHSKLRHCSFGPELLVRHLCNAYVCAAARRRTGALCHASRWLLPAVESVGYCCDAQVGDLPADVRGMSRGSLAAEPLVVSSTYKQLSATPGGARPKRPR